MAVRLVIKEDDKGVFHWDHSVHAVEAVLDSANENGLDESSPLLQPLTNPGVLRHAPDWLVADPDRRTDETVILDAAGDAVNGMVLNLFIEGDELQQQKDVRHVDVITPSYEYQEKKAFWYAELVDSSITKIRIPFGKRKAAAKKFLESLPDYALHEADQPPKVMWVLSEGDIAPIGYESIKIMTEAEFKAKMKDVLKPDFDRLQARKAVAAIQSSKLGSTPVQEEEDADPLVIDGLEYNRNTVIKDSFPPNFTLDDNDPLLRPSEFDLSPEAEAERAAIFEKHFAGKSPRKSGKPTLFVMGGGGGSGKGTIKKILISSKKLRIDSHTIELDPDEIKLGMVRYKAIVAKQDTRAAAVVHEDSSALAKKIRDAAITSKYDILLDVTLSSGKKGVQLLKMFKDAGYRISLTGVFTDPRAALLRSFSRGAKSGRYVPQEILLDAHRGFIMAYRQYAAIADESVLYDNSEEEPFKLAESKGGVVRINDQERFEKFQGIADSICIDAEKISAIYNCGGHAESTGVSSADQFHEELKGKIAKFGEDTYAARIEALRTMPRKEYDIAIDQLIEELDTAGVLSQYEQRMLEIDKSRTEELKQMVSNAIG